MHKSSQSSVKLTKVEQSLIDKNLKDTPGQLLPAKWFELKNESFILQLKRIRNVLQPKVHADHASGKFLYRLDLTDGKNDIVALVDSNIRGISTPNGSKVRVTCPVECVGNFVFLTAGNCQFLGGSSGDRSNLDKVKTQGVRVGSAIAAGPPRWVPYSGRTSDGALAIEDLASLSVK